MLSVSLVFGVNDLLALKDFNTFLNNFLIHEKPSFVEHWLAKRAQGWIQRRAMKVFGEIRQEVAPASVDVALNQCSTAMFAVLALSTQLSFQPKQGSELFLAVAAAELTYNKLKSPRSDSTYA